MSNMILDSYTFVKQPIEMSLLEKDKFASSLLTYTSVAYFSWGTTMVGKKVSLSWGGMTTTQFDVFQTKFEADVQVVFDPQNGSGITYNVEIITLRGKYHLSLLDSADFRVDVEMELLIISEV